VTADSPRILITGIEGFTGRHMLDLLNSRKDTPHIVGVHKAPFACPPTVERLELVECDVTDHDAVMRVIGDASPDAVYHFAGLVSVAGSFKAPLDYMNVNVEGTMNVLEAVRKANSDGKVFVPGSAETYGKVGPDSLPIKEDTRQNPSNPYGLSKLLQERVCAHYHDSIGLKVYVTRTFHTVGPGQGLGFVCSDFAKQVADVEAGSQEPVIRVGNLYAKRDFLDVRDLVRAYEAITEKGRPGVPYNVCSGKSVSVQHILDTLISLSDTEVSVEVDPEKLRPVDVPEFLGDNTRLRSETSWSQSIPLERTLEDILTWWRSRPG